MQRGPRALARFRPTQTHAGRRVSYRERHHASSIHVHVATVRGS